MPVFEESKSLRSGFKALVEFFCLLARFSLDQTHLPARLDPTYLSALIIAPKNSMLTISMLTRCALALELGIKE